MPACHARFNDHVLRSPLMFRRVSYRTAVTAFVFTGLWFMLGLMLLFTPIPGALGIRGEMFVAWLMLFFATLALSGLTLVIAAINGIFPRNVRAPSAAEALWGAPQLENPSMPRRPASRSSAQSRQGR
jgi:hypothetical protein